MPKPIATKHHGDGPRCELCAFKLTEAHPTLESWFNGVKSRYINAHVAWSYRGPEDQERAYNDGKSKLHYPFSPHNNMVDDKPMSLALDIFMINEDGEAVFPPLWYAKIDKENRDANEPIIWGGRFRSIADLDHFQVSVKVDHEAA